MDVRGRPTADRAAGWIRRQSSRGYAEEPHLVHRVEVALDQRLRRLMRHQQVKRAGAPHFGNQRVNLLVRDDLQLGPVPTTLLACVLVDRAPSAHEPDAQPGDLCDRAAPDVPAVWRELMKPGSQ